MGALFLNSVGKAKWHPPMASSLMSQLDTVDRGDYSNDTTVFPSLPTTKYDFGPYGVYTWHWEYNVWYDEVADVNWPHIRLSGTFSDEDTNDTDSLGGHIMDSGKSWMYTRSFSRNTYASNQLFIDEYINQVETLLEVYGPNGTYFDANPSAPYNPVMNWEITNEPNFSYMYSNGSYAEKVTLYCDLVQQAYTYLKPLYPDVTFVGVSAGGGSSQETTWVSALFAYNSSIDDYFDVMSIHPYANTVPPESFRNESWGGYSIAENVATCKTYTDKPLWVTEIGWEVDEADGGAYSRDDTSLPENLHAAYVMRMYLLCLRLNIPVCHIMFIKDSDGFNGGFFETGPIYRPAAIAAKNLIALLPSPYIQEILWEKDDSKFGYRIKADHTDIESDEYWVLWTLDDKQTVSVSLDNGIYTVYDMLGTNEEVTVASGTMSREIGAYPIYIKIPYSGPDASFVTTLETWADANTYNPTGTTYYCDPVSGDTANNDGSEASPWGTLQSVIDADLIERWRWDIQPYADGAVKVLNTAGTVVDGDEIKLLGGDHGSLAFPLSGHFREGLDYIYISPVDGETPYFDYAQLDTVDYLYFKGITFIQAPAVYTNESFIQLQGTNYWGVTSHVTIDGCSLETTGDQDTWSDENWETNLTNGWDDVSSGITATGDYIHIKNCTLNKVANGIIMGGANCVVRDNIVQNFSLDASRTTGHDILVTDNTFKDSYKVNDNHNDGVQGFVSAYDSVYNICIDNNYMIESTDRTRYSFYFQGIGFFDGPFENLIFRNNTIVCDNYNGITLYGADGALVEGNIVCPLTWPASSVEGPPWLKIDDDVETSAMDNCVCKDNYCLNFQLNDDVEDINNTVLTTSLLDYLFVDYDNADFTRA